jgi:hypothetical protein
MSLSLTEKPAPICTLQEIDELRAVLASLADLEDAAIPVKSVRVALIAPARLALERSLRRIEVLLAMVPGTRCYPEPALAVAPKSTPPMSATQRASELFFKTPGNLIPENAKKYRDHMCRKYAGCGEVIITAFAHYAPDR